MTVKKIICGILSVCLIFNFSFHSFASPPHESFYKKINKQEILENRQENFVISYKPSEPACFVENVTHIDKNFVDNFKTSYPFAIIIPDSVEKIDEDAFSSLCSICFLVCNAKWIPRFYSKKIKNIVVSQNTQIIENVDFSRFQNLKHLYLPESLKDFDEIFLNYLNSPAANEIVCCTPKTANELGLTAFNLPKTMQKITNDDAPFFSSVAKITIPKSIKSIEENAFSQASLLKCVSADPKWAKFLPKNSICLFLIPKNVKEIPENAFEGFYCLSDIVIPNSVEFIGKNSFKGCFNLRKIEIESPDVKIHPSAFEDCYFIKRDFKFFSPQEGTRYISRAQTHLFKSLLYVDLPKSVETIEEGAFDFDELKCIQCFPHQLKFFNKHKIETIFIKDGTTLISKEALQGFENLKEIYLPPSIKNIEKETFSKLPKVSIILNDKDGELRDSSILKNTILPSDFYKKLKDKYNIVIPQSIRHIEYGALESINRRISITCDTKWLNFIDGKNIEKVTLFPGTKIIYSDDFKNCTSLNALNLPLSIETINFGENDNFGCVKEISLDPKLCKIFGHDKRKCWNKVNIAEGVKVIPDSSFAGCENLLSIKLPSTLESIEDNAFLDCKKLCEIDIPDSVNFVATNAFKNCGKISSLKCHEKILKFIPLDIRSKIENLKIRGEIEKISESDFSGYSSLIKLSLPHKIKKISNFSESQPLKGLRSIKSNFEILKSVDPSFLTKIALSKGTSKILPHIFKKFNSVKTLKLPTSLESIDKDEIRTLKNLCELECSKKIIKSLDQETKSKIKDITFIDQNGTISESDLRECENLDSIKLLHHSEDSKIENEKSETPKVKHQTTIDDLSKIDCENTRYLPYVKSILENIENNRKVPILHGTSLYSISARLSHVFLDIKNSTGLKPRPVQCLAIIRLIDSVLNGSNIVGEIKTGEGKSFIVSVTASVLALYGKKVDVISSNMELASRDELEQKKIYALFGISSAPFYNLKADKCIIDSDNPQYKDCEGNYNMQALNCDIIYSTAYNLECLYLHSIFDFKKSRMRPYDVVIVDEVDSMLMDMSSSPTRICRSFNTLYSKDILVIVDLMRYFSVEDIIDVLKHIFPGCGNFDHEKILELKNAAIVSQSLHKNIDYIIENGRLVIIDKLTGLKKPKTIWQKSYHEMIQLKENIEPNPPNLEICSVNQKTFFNFYSKIIGVTGTLGSEAEQNFLMDCYKVKIFKLPRNIAPHKIVTIKDRPTESEFDVFRKVYFEALAEIRKGRPVLIIFDSIKHVDEFCLPIKEIKYQKIRGIDTTADKSAVSHAGEKGMLTVATNAAGRGVDIKIKDEIETLGGLHVIVPFHMQNWRIIEQAIGRSSRQGQNGSASIYLEKGEKFSYPIKPAPIFDNLDILQNKFASFLKTNFPWIGNVKPAYPKNCRVPFNIDSFSYIEFMLNKIVAGYKLILKNDQEEQFRSFILCAILNSWAILYCKMEANEVKYNDFSTCETEYNNFTSSLLSYFPNKTDVNTQEVYRYIFSQHAWESGVILDIAYASIKISGELVLVAFPESIPLAVGISSALGGLDSVYKDLKEEKDINWYRFLTKSLGGGIKSYIGKTVVPEHWVMGNVLKGSTDSIESFLSNAFDGNISWDTVKSALIKGSLTTTSGMLISADYKSKKVTGKKRIVKVDPEELDELLKQNEKIEVPLPGPKKVPIETLD